MKGDVSSCDGTYCYYSDSYQMCCIGVYNWWCCGDWQHCARTPDACPSATPVGMAKSKMISPKMGSSKLMATEKKKASAGLEDASAGLEDCGYLDVIACSGEIMQDYAACASAGSVADQIACINNMVSDGCKACVCEILSFLC